MTGPRFTPLRAASAACAPERPCRSSNTVVRPAATSKRSCRSTPIQPRPSALAAMLPRRWPRNSPCQHSTSRGAAGTKTFIRRRRRRRRRRTAALLAPLAAARLPQQRRPRPRPLPVPQQAHQRRRLPLRPPPVPLQRPPSRRPAQPDGWIGPSEADRCLGIGPGAQGK
jgi:hypothetical protein